MSLRILELFGYAEIQGAPRVGRRCFGVPPGGAFDRESMAYANALLGNSLDAPVLELGMATVSLEATEAVSFALVGAGVEGASYCLRSGEVFRLKPGVAGCRAYLALSGGVLRDGPELRPRVARVVKPRKLAFSALSLDGGPLRVIRGPQAGLLDWDGFLSCNYRATRLADRVGIRLSGPERSHSLELPSEPATPGVVQVLPSGLPIILGPDGPTIGGYPKVAVVSSMDLNRVGQLRAGDEVEFEPVDLSWSRDMAVEMREMIGRRCEELRLGL